MQKSQIFPSAAIAGVKEKALDNSANFSFLYEIVRYYMAQEKITIEELSAQTGIPERIIKQMRSKKESQHRFDLRYLVAVSIGLHMIFIDSWYLIYLNGYGLRKNDKLERFYLFLISECNTLSVPECNVFLIEHDLPPLTNSELA